ncbi:MAG: sigma-70 family RNA polymerase sigma factor [Rudaea sp.]|uniref:RNA polymerase sigma factor n=2 Tax=unclassified Rudaea TaxID=2627037 RepID=UPI0010F6CC0E|nr:sigma-70 family RNA polymerase sigma factor [Rudaea sp. 3F27F6]MBN8888371.1 sigma-70 family RNA polymerase sigma factor [Rudaea sp.]MBR0346175.1 sigma-70 family RNA polymerase sigma factor [Rudaea sp.]
MFSRSAETATPRSVASAADDAVMLERIARGDMRAFETLYRAYFARLARFIERTTRRPELVEEILNDTMFVVSTSAHKFNRTSKASTWIFAIAYRKSLKALRDVDDPVEADDALEAVPDTDAIEPRDEVMRTQLRRILTEAVDALSANHRAVIELTYFQEAGYREIAEIMGCPIETVKTRMFHARRRLKALLPERLEDIL